MGIHKKLSSAQKALQINLDDTLYGSFAEIGAGQEVAGQFFRAGAAAGTIAKTMSAYDMTMSDKIYGGSSRYVSEERLLQMLDKEYSLLEKRLEEKRGADTCFFAFADTIAAKGFKGGGNYHGWAGIRFRHMPTAHFSELLIHVKLLDTHNLFQQQALGDLGVNIVHSAFYRRESANEFVLSLMDSLSSERVLIDTIKVDGPAFEHLDPRLLSLELVHNGYTGAVMFNEQGEVVNASEYLYKKNILCVRGGYRPPTSLSIEMFKKGQEAFVKNLKQEQVNNITTLAEISMNRLLERGEIDAEDFLHRVDLLAKLKQPVIITNFLHFHQVSIYLSALTPLKVAFAVRVHNLKDVLTQENYDDLEGGFLGSLGMMFGKNTQMYVYPEKSDDGLTFLRSDSVKVPEVIKPLVDYFFGNRFVQDIFDIDEDIASIWSKNIIKMREDGDEGWKTMVPEVIVDEIESKNILN